MVTFMSTHTEALVTSSASLATALFLILSFRVNRAITRWAHGRHIYGHLLADVRSLALGAQVCCCFLR